MNSSVVSSSPVLSEHQSISAIPAEQTSSSVWVSDQSSFLRRASPTELLAPSSVFPFMLATIHSVRLKGGGGGGKGSVPVIKVSSLWVVTQPDRGSAPDLLMRALPVSEAASSLGPDMGVFSSRRSSSVYKHFPPSSSGLQFTWQLTQRYIRRPSVLFFLL